MTDFCKRPFSPSDQTAAKQLILAGLPEHWGELDLSLAYIAPMLAKGADIFLVGEKKGGIASAAKKLDSYDKGYPAIFYCIGKLGERYSPTIMA